MMKQWQYEGKDGTRQTWAEGDFSSAVAECARLANAAGNSAELHQQGDMESGGVIDVKSDGAIIGTLRLVDVQPALTPAPGVAGSGAVKMPATAQPAQSKDFHGVGELPISFGGFSKK